MSISEDLVFINSIPMMINMPNVEDIGIYSSDQEVVQACVPGKIVSEISSILDEALKDEKAKGQGIEVNSLANEIDKRIEDYAQTLIYSGSDYFIIKEFHCYVDVQSEKASIIFLKKPNDMYYDKDEETLERVKYTTRRVVSSILHNNDHIRALYEEQGEAVLYLYGYNIINKKTPIALYFPNISYEDWLAKFGRDPEEFMYLAPDDIQQKYFLDHDMYNYINYWDEKFDKEDEDYLRSIYGDEWKDHLDEIEEASYGEDCKDEDDSDDDEDDYDEDDEDDESDLPPLPWN